jgi:Radical SAM superfamily/Iron-sulfur cluster-binding domain
MIDAAASRKSIPSGLKTRWKASVFVWLRGSTLIDDLTDESHELVEAERQILAALKTNPASLEDLAATLSRPPSDLAADLESLVERGLLVPAEEDESGKFAVNRVDIETSSHCNARCLYCPVSIDPKPKRIMPMDLFTHIVQQIAPYNPEWVSLNSFSEPLLDPFFIERCQSLEEVGLKVALFTNATPLKPKIREYLGASQVLHSVVVNFASGNPEEWGRLMGLPPALHARTLENMIELAKVYRGPISISVHGHDGTHRRRAENIAAIFSSFPNVSVTEFPTNTLAGNINGELVGLPTVTSAAKLAGCGRLAGHLQIAWNADVFMCCLDYKQEYIFGNLAESSVHDILGGAIARKYRSQVYGLKEAEPNLLCRNCCHIRLEP